MSDSQPEELAALLSRMPEIAKAVSAFPEAVQQSAFDALMAAATGTSLTETGNTESPGAIPTNTKQRKRRTPKAEGDGSRTTTRRTSGAPSVIRDLDLAPKGKTSLKDFVAEKQPKSQDDQNVISVYYLTHMLGISTVTLNHVFTCYKDMRWREPASLANRLSITSLRKRFLDTANLDDIKLTPAGRNHVEQDLPPVKKGK